MAVDAGSNQISVLRLGYNGVPQLVGAPVSSGGIDPNSIAVSGNLVYVENAGAGGTNVTGFYLAPWGGLYPLPHSTVTLPEGSSPGDALFNATGDKLAVTLVGSSQIASFDVRLAAWWPLPARPTQDRDSDSSARSSGRPTRTSCLSATPTTGPGSGQSPPTTSMARPAAAQSASSPFADTETAPCWVEISHDGRFLFTTNTGSGSISSYAISPNGELKYLSTVQAGEKGIGDVDLRLSPDGKTLFVNGSGADVVAAFAVNGGELTQLASSPAPCPQARSPQASSSTSPHLVPSPARHALSGRRATTSARSSLLAARALPVPAIATRDYQSSAARRNHILMPPERAFRSGPPA